MGGRGSGGGPAGRVGRVAVAGLILLPLLLMSAPAALAVTVTLTITLRGTVPGGTVGVFPLELECHAAPLPGTCVFAVASGTALTLSANSLPPNSPAGIFSGGAGSAAGCGASTCSFAITTDSALTATFDPAMGPFATVTVTLTGTGKGDLDVGNFPCQNKDPADVSFCSSRYAPGSLVTLSGAEAAPGSVFAGYSGACVSSARGCGFTITGDSAVTVAFNQQLVPTGTGSVESVSGTVTLRTPLESGPLTVASAPSSGSLIQTGSDGAATVMFPDERQVSIGPSTQVTVFRSPTDEIVLNQIRGGLTHRAAPLSPSHPYRVQTPIAAIRPTGTDFSSQYTESRGAGELVARVQQGIVEVVDRRGQLTALGSGMEVTFTDAVPRSTLILPVDGTSILEGRPQTFRWTAVPGAAAYVLEYTLDASGFAEANPPTVQSPRNTLRVSPGAFTEVGGTVEFPILVPPGAVPRGTRAQWRVFPTDGSGQTLAGTTASDAASFDVLPSRVAPVLPPDGDVVAGGQTTTFSWTSYPGATGYLFEFTLNPSGFAVPNAATVESPGNTLRVGPGAFAESAGVASFPLFVAPGVAPAGTRAQWRVFPLDGAGQILTDSTASDARTAVLH